MRKHFVLILGLVLVGIIVGLIYWPTHESLETPQAFAPPTVERPTQSQKTETASVVLALPTAVPAPAVRLLPSVATIAVPPGPDTALQSPLPAEVAATRRMYGAHAPLRTPEVSDPDSEQNRLILELMVRKALTRAESASSKKP